MTFTQQNQVAPALVSVDLNSGAQTSDWMGVENYDHITFLIHIHTHGAASTITVNEATDNAAAGTTPIAFTYRKCATTAVDDWGALTAATAAGFATDGTTVNQVYAIEIDCRQLSGANDFVSVSMSDPGAAMVVSMLAVGSGGRYKGATATSMQS